jgi:NADH-quinone oxidoreductase subunit M
MGFCLLGMSAFTQQGIDGAVLNLWTHGLISPMLFLIVGVIYDRAHHRNIEGFGGLASQVPEYAGLLGLAFFASLGLPGLCGFWAEFTVLLGSLERWQMFTIISATSVIITAAYYLWAIQRMMLGKLNPAYSTLPDVNWRERLSLYPLGALIILFGFYPKIIVDLIEGSLRNLILPLQ